MAKIVDFENIYEHNLNENNNNCMTLFFPSNIADGKIDMFKLNEGLFLYHLDLKVNDNFMMENKFDKKVLSFTSFLNGKMNFINKDLNIDKTYNQNSLTLNTFSCDGGMSYYQKGDNIKVLSISMEQSFLKDIFCNKNNKIVDSILESFTKDMPFSTINEISCNYKLLQDLNNLLNNDLDKNFKKLYLQSKVYEFLYENFNLLEERTEELLPQIEKEYLLKVDVYIQKNLYKELTIKELAKIASSNETKFQRNFKIFFKTTVFKYIFNCRMEKAKDLLKNNDISISEVTSIVGYKFQSNFSSAFYKKFGVRPKELMKGRKYYY